MSLEKSARYSIDEIFYSEVCQVEAYGKHLIKLQFLKPKIHIFEIPKKKCEDPTSHPSHVIVISTIPPPHQKKSPPPHRQYFFFQKLSKDNKKRVLKIL